MTYEQALKVVLELEGGYSNNPDDPGGSTYKGVTQGTYNSYRKRNNLAARDVRLIDDHELGAIYRAYWVPVCQVELERGNGGLALAVFDMAVNAGPGNALRLYAGNDTVTTYCIKRIKYYQQLRTWATFGKGWTNRVMRILEVAEQERKVYLVTSGNPVQIISRTVINGVVVNPVGDKVYVNAGKVDAG